MTNDKSNQEIIESMFQFGDFVTLDKDTDGGEGLFKGAVLMVCGNNPTFLGPEDPYAMRLMMLCAPVDEDDHVDSARVFMFNPDNITLIEGMHAERLESVYMVDFAEDGENCGSSKGQE